MKHVFLTAMISLVLVAPMVAQQGGTKPPVAQQQLDLFLGDWEGPGSYEANGNTYEFTMICSANHIVDGMAINLDSHAELKNMGMYKEKDLIAWDPMLKQVTMFTISNMGEVSWYTGNWVEGKKNTLKVTSTRIMDNDTYETEQTVFFHDGNQMTWRAITTKNGEAAGEFKATLTKK